MQIGGALRRQSQQRRYGEAYQQGGWGAVEQTAGGFGDLETAQSAQEVQAEAEERAIARAQRNAAVLSNAATSLLGVPYEQRRARMQQLAPMIAPMGISEEQILGFDPTDENLGNIRALQGQFSQYTDIERQGNAIIGIRADGRIDVLREEEPEWQTNGTTPYRVMPGGQVQLGQGTIPHQPPAAMAWGPQGRPPSGFRWSDDGQSLEAITGGPGDPNARAMQFGPDQRARVAITYQGAAGAATQLDQMESQGYGLGDDWGAVAVETMGGGDPNSLASGAARAFGGRDYQQYRSASSAFEASMLPILSGAAVTETEALRTIRAALPQVGDGAEVQADKSRRRRQMLNGAALIGGYPPPYPELGIPPWAQRYLDQVNASAGGGGGPGTAPTPGPAPGVRRYRYDPDTGQLEPVE